MGAQIRAAVDNRRMAESLGINITRLFTITFAFGSGMAALGGGLGAEFLGLDPQYPLKYLVMFLIVVAVGGLGRITGVFYAALIIGVLDFTLKKYLPQGGTVFIYAHDHPAAAVAAAGPVRTAGMSVTAAPVTATISRRARSRGATASSWWETLPWLLALGVLFRLPALSRLRHRAPDHGAVCDLARSRARLRRHRHARPRRVLRRRRLHRRHAGEERNLDRADLRPGHRRDRSRALVGFASGLVLLRTTGLTLLMLTLCTMGLLEEIANMAADVTGGFDGLDSLPIKPIFGKFEFDVLYSSTQYLYVLGVLLVCFVFVRMLVYSPFGHSLTGIRENTLRMHAVGAPVRWRLVVCYTISAALAGVAGALWAQANAYVNLSTLGLDRAATVLIMLVLGGYGRLYGAHRRRGGLYGAVALPVEGLSDRLAAWPRPPAGGDRAVRARRHPRHRRPALAAVRPRPRRQTPP